MCLEGNLQPTRDLARLQGEVDRLNRLLHPGDLSFTRDGKAIAAALRPATREASESLQSRIWLFHLDGSAEIWRANGPKMNAIQPGELFCSPLFPGLAIDPAWIRDYPDEIELVRRFTPEIRVLPDPYDPKLTRKAEQLAAQIAQHFELVGRQGLLASWFD